jgi:hypothetical protein
LRCFALKSRTKLVGRIPIPQVIGNHLFTDSLHRYLFCYLFTLDLLDLLRSRCPNHYSEIKDLISLRVAGFTLQKASQAKVREALSFASGAGYYFADFTFP